MVDCAGEPSAPDTRHRLDHQAPTPSRRPPRTRGHDGRGPPVTGWVIGAGIGIGLLAGGIGVVVSQRRRGVSGRPKTDDQAPADALDEVDAWARGLSALRVEQHKLDHDRWDLTDGTDPSMTRRRDRLIAEVDDHARWSDDLADRARALSQGGPQQLVALEDLAWDARRAVAAGVLTQLDAAQLLVQAVAGVPQGSRSWPSLAQALVQQAARRGRDHEQFTRLDVSTLSAPGGPWHQPRWPSGIGPDLFGSGPAV
jgi:hypothetical protein